MTHHPSLDTMSDSDVWNSTIAQPEPDLVRFAKALFQAMASMQQERVAVVGERKAIACAIADCTNNALIGC
jgi:hypothetical protein